MRLQLLFIFADEIRCMARVIFAVSPIALMWCLISAMELMTSHLPLQSERSDHFYRFHW